MTKTSNKTGGVPACAECGDSIKRAERRISLCPDCGVHYCSDHYKRGKWGYVVISSEVQKRIAKCPKGHKKDEYREDVCERPYSI